MVIDVEKALPEDGAYWIVYPGGNSGVEAPTGSAH